MRTRLHAPLRQRRLHSLGSLAAVLSLLAVTLTLLGACTKKAPEGGGETAAGEHSLEPAAPAKIDLWKGVPPLEPQPTDYATELKPANEGPAPPPSVSERVELPFPPPAAPPKTGPDSAPAPGPLEILRFSPEGDQSLVDAVSVAFNQPMVPLASIDDLRELPVPLSIEPQPPGQFRWLGTQMVVFEPKGRMPFSTTYTARVKAGARSELGAALAKDKQWTFTTPALALAWSSPGDKAEGQGLNPTIQLRFNQPIQRDALAAAITLKGGGASVTLRSLPRAEWAERAPATDEEAARTLILQLAADARLRPNTSYRLQIPAGVYGEGPNKSKAVSVNFKTYPPLTLRGPDCSRWDCHAGGGVTLHASTSVVGPTLEKRLTVEPPVEDLVVSGGSSPYLSGKFLGDTSYTVTVEAGVEDSHGQTLARKFTTRFKIPPLDPQLGLRVPGKNPAVLELSHSRILDLRVGGHKDLELRARRFSADELTTFLSASFQGDEYAWPYNAPEHQLEQKYDVKDSRKQIKRLGVDLQTLLPEPGSFAFLNFRSEPYQRWGYTQRDHFTQIVSRTDLGVSVALDHDSGVALVTSVEQGTPVSGAQVELYKRNYDKPLWTGTTDARGLAEIEYSDSLSSPYVLVKANKDVSYTPLQTDVQGRWRGYYGRYNDDDEPRVFFYTERTPYKPGDTVHLSGVLRKEKKGPEGQVLPWKQNVTASYTVTGPRGHELTKGEVKVSAIGTFSVDIETDAAGDTGDYRFRLTVPGGLFGSDRTFWHSFPVETYRVPEFEVEVARPSSDPLMFGDTLEAEVIARYLHGAPLVGGEVSYTLKRQETGFSPPGAENQTYSFGRRTGSYSRYRSHYYGGFGGATKVLERGHGSTNARGVYEVKRALKAVEYAEGVTPPKADGEASGDEKDDETQEDRDPPAAATYSIESEVMDQNHQAIAGRASFVVHPAAVYPGVRSERTVYKAGETARIEGVVVDLAGKRLEGQPLEITLQRSDTERTAVEKNGRWSFEYKTTTTEVGKCERRSKAAPTVCELPVEKAGNYTVRALSEDDQGRKNLSTMTLYVHGDDAVIWQEDQKTVDLVPQQREYKPGETATLLVRSPFQTARGLVVLEREGIVDYLPVTIEGGTATVSFPVTETMIPNLGVSAVVTRGRVDVAGAPPGQDLGRPAHASGHVELDVSKDPKKIAVTVTPERDAIAPGETLTVTLETKTTDGAPLPAAVAVFVVDEGVLSLMNYETPDPLGFFHRTRSAMVSLYDLRTYLLPQDETAEVTAPKKNKEFAQTIALNGFAEADDEAPEPEEESTERDRGDMAVGGRSRNGGGLAKKARKASRAAPGAPPPPAAMPVAASTGAVALDADKAMANDVKLRTMFATTAYFNPEVTTDENGAATLEIPMPENLTSFRIMAVAIDPAQDDRFGSGDSSVRVRKPIMLRPSMPRFANFGDKFEGSVMVDNQTDAPQAVLVGARGLNVTFSGETERQVTIPAGESKEVRFAMETDLVGTMRLQFAALANGGRDATELELPVLYPATRQAFATYGATDSSVVQTVKPPAGALPGYGGLEVSMSSTALNGLEDAVGFLVDYRYECTEQAASRLLPIFVLGPVLNEFPIAELKDLKRREALATAGIAKILSRQNSDGGFRYWDTSARSSAYLSTWTTFALLEGKKAGFEVDEDALKRAKSYLRGYIQRGDKDYWGWYYSWTTRAFALWLLSREDEGADLFAKVYAHKGEMPLYARALLMSAAHKYGETAERDAQLADFRARVKEGARVVHFIESKSESAAEGLQLLMHSDVQTDAIALMALLEVAPEDPLLPKVMAGIMSERDPRKGGRWGTTHANAWALLSASRYFTTVEKTVPDYIARIWLDEQFAGQQEFRGRDMSVVDQSVPMRALLAGADKGAPKDKTLLLAKEGPGKLYYRLGLRYAPADLKMNAEDQGFTVSRTYAPLALGDREPDPESVKRLPNGDWQIKVGTTVQVSLTVVARDRATFVVVDDPLPAGLEGQNARFDTTTRIDGANSSRRDVGDYGGLLGASGRSSRSSYWWHRWWRWSHTDLRDDRMLLFADRLPAGVYTHTYTARATTVGTFQLPPIHAEGMYTPEQFGHSASAVVHVVE